MARSRIVNLANFEQFTAINVLSDPGHIGGPVIIPNCVQIRLVWNQVAKGPAYNVLHASYTGGFVPTTAACDTIRSAIGSALTTRGVLPFMPTTAAFHNVDMRDLNSPNQPIVLGTATDVVGTTSGTPLPMEVAIALSIHTALTGPSNRGRIYIPNWASNAVIAGNLVSPTLVTALNGLGSDIKAAIASVSGLNMVIAHPARNAYTGATGTQHPARAAGTVPVTAVVCQSNTFDSQRRRGLK